MANDRAADLPSIADLERRAARRLPHFSWEYLDQGTGADQARDRNLEALRDVRLVPRLLRGVLEPTVETTLFGVGYAAPFGIAPIGMAALIWPGADRALAEAAARIRIPYTMSTVATEAYEVTGALADGMAWFQLYPPRDEGLCADLIARAADAGFTALVLTADVPVQGRRERQIRARVRVPPAIGPKILLQAARRPAWSLGVLRRGLPRFRGLERYTDRATMRSTAGFVHPNFGGTLSFEYLARVRSQWDGPLVVKGIMHPEDAVGCVAEGADGIQVSNHGGRQLDASPAALDAMGPILDRVGGTVPVLFDGGVRSGLDIARAIALGASYVFCGRAFMYGLGARGRHGVEHAYRILRDDLVNVMIQVGCESLDQLSDRLAH